jgi:hypothetical protein
MFDRMFFTIGVLFLSPVAFADEVSFSRDIRPILSANCFGCHGTDEAHRKAELRLDTFSGATADHEGRAAIVPGKPEASELLARVKTHDSESVMPPGETGKVLTPKQIELLEQWITSGAEYQEHWAFVPPVAPPVPQFSDEQSQRWIKNPIDAFVLQRLQKEGLRPSPAAESSTLLRRASLDLTGLPPEVSELDAFTSALESNAEDQIWSQEIERLLASPHFGEKWARHWLDAARYADSDGFEKDKPRFVWFYRDWVVRSLNNDKPYNEFLKEQLAGDLIPNRTQDQLVATGFLRNSMINEEGGVDPEQFRMEAMFDRMDAVGKAMLGLTIQCSQCHNHKYDPISQTDYYRMFAFLNNCDEAQATVYTQAALQKREVLLTEIERLETELQQAHPMWREQMNAWATEIAQQTNPWSVVRPELDSSGGQKHYLLSDGSVLAQGYAPTKHTTVFDCNTELKTLTGFRLELLLDSNLPHGGPGRAVDGLCAITEFQVDVAPLSDPGRKQSVKFVKATADVSPQQERELAKIYYDKTDKKRITGPIEKAFDGDNLTAWSIDAGPGRSNVPRNAVFVPETPLTSESGFRLSFKLVQMHGGWNSDDNQNNNPGRFRFSVTDRESPVADMVPTTVRAAAQKTPEQRTSDDWTEMFSYWRTTRPEFASTNTAIEELWAQHPHGETQLVLHERAVRRPTYLLTRGDFLKPADEMTVGVPSALNPLANSEVPERLQMAEWIADRRSPTTARAIVNRIWQEYFGTGFVQTAEDLGTQGEYPSHPELLDWLAVELMDHDWSLKHIHRLIANSATYRQSSHVTKELYQTDPSNRLLARGPRFRLSGEIVRDVALAVSGLLNREVGGPPVYPPAPDFLFLPPASYGPKTWTTETGENRYRRALYTFRFRSVPYPMLQNFDTPRGDAACVRRVRSNTPIQALTTLNEDLFVECSRALAMRMVSLGGDDQTRIVHAFRRCTARNPSAAELETLLAFLQQQKDRFASEPEQNAIQLATGSSEGKLDLPANVAASDVAAWTAVTRVLLNLDEVVTKE